MQRLTSFLLLLYSCTLTLAQTACPNPHDSNSDGAVTISDLLELLGLFGDVDTDQDGVWDSVDDCVDTTACNYAADPTEACAFADALGNCGGGCEGDSDGDGICDDEDDCFGIVDECGICNGPGPTEIVVDEITILYDSVYAEQINQWFVFEVGADTTFSFECAPSFSSCGDPLLYHGHFYATVQIGNQCWYAENLRSEFYANGDSIPFNEGGYGTGNWPVGYGAQGVHSNSESNLINYGRLYNFQAVTDERGLCPSGWHVPSDEDFMALEIGLGMSIEEAEAEGYRGTDEGTQMKSSIEDEPQWDGSNLSGFSALPGRRRDGGGYDLSAGSLSYGVWWTTTHYGGGYDRYWSRELWSDDGRIRKRDFGPSQGISVRCIQD